MSPTSSRWRNAADVAVISIATLALHVTLARQSGLLASGGLQDTDAYMRLIRIQELWQSGDWYETLTSSLGAPGKLSLHWTRPLDLLILLPALLLNVAGLPIERAIYWVGFWISPILQVLACLVAANAAKMLWPQHGAWRLAGLMVLFNGAALTYCLAGRPDHHSLGLLLTLLAAGQTIRAALQPNNARPALAAGAWAGVGIWVSPEALIGTGATIISFGLLWLLRPDAGGNWARLGRRFSCGMAIVLLAAILIEQPPAHWLLAEYDKVSSLHLALALTAMIDFWIAERIAWREPLRIVAMIVVALASAISLGLVFPGFYLGPLGNISNKEAMVFLDDILEMSSIWPVNRGTADQFFGMIGNALAALPVIPICLHAWRRDERFAPALFLSVSYLVALFGALEHQRLAVFLSAFGALLGCGLFALICDLAQDRMPATRTMARLFGAMVVVFGGQLWLLAPSEVAPPKAAVCNPKPVADWLNAAHPGILTPEPVGADRHTPIIITESINYPPELAYRTGYRFVGGPYHRGVQDVADMYALALSTDETAAEAVLARRQADYVLICIVEVPKVIGESAPNSLYHRLLRGEVPAWLQPLEMSAEASREFRLFAVKHQ
ncbi:hypothetical protein [Dongia rigui]|uniref:Uncharacterized protein n=1 Tax=Dongia rigui TaxID=940149 RepID=A0ABU5DTZ7_9PROT|nr:hypothetical protein [Dongia rigui]MDY0870775.1 hypothetical protein [Dongia rigui]